MEDKILGFQLEPVSKKPTRQLQIPEVKPFRFKSEARPLEYGPSGIYRRSCFSK